jgi:DNA-binding MltR family transcriptional regulator
MDAAFDAAIEFRSTLNAETDRGCALMAAAYLDDQLAVLLKAYFVDDLTVANTLLVPSQALGAFSARIDVAYLLGLLSREERKALHLIRKIRNDFGHVAQPLSFRHQVIADRCKNLQHLSFVKRSSHKAMLTWAVMAVLAGIDARRRNATHRQTPKDVIPAGIVGNVLPEAQAFPPFAEALRAYLGAKSDERPNALVNLRTVMARILGIDATNSEDTAMLDKLIGALLAIVAKSVARAGAPLSTTT